MNRKERRALRPHEIARADQTQASLREQSIRQPGSRFYLLRYINVGEKQCCWCDCPMEDHQTPGYVCDGCPESAIYVVDQIASGAGTSYPLCHRHLQQYRDQYMPLILANAKRREFHTFNAYDADLTGGAR